MLDIVLGFMRVLVCLLMVFAVASRAWPSEAIPVKDLRVDGIYATRTGDSTLYCLLGANACIERFPDNAWNQDSSIVQWVTAHPNAVAVPLSTQRWGVGKATPSEPRAYLWIEDQGDSLNVALVREGHYAAGTMIDMVEAEQHMIASLPPDARTQMEKEGKQRLDEETPRRLVSDEDYSAKLKLVLAAEMDAKAHQRGIWSEEGFPGRAPPQDSYMIRQFMAKRDSFERVRVLTLKYPPLADMNRRESTAQIARLAGVPQEAVQEYRRLLEQLNANEELSRLGGFDEVCLIVSDIVVGAFDNGYIKGYVYRREIPNPIVDDLDHANAAAGVYTIYRRIDDKWYLFESAH